MKYGVVFPQTEIEQDPIAIRDYAQAAEAMGYEYLLVYDHVLGANPDRPGGWRGPYTHTDSFHEPFALFGYLSGLTERIEFVTGILILPQRQTALVAKQAAQVDFLSGGRLRLGIGVGWNKVEYDALGEDFSTRGKRSAEQVTVLRELWTNELVTFEGEYHRIEDAGLNPMPVQRPIPVWFGGGADVVLQRMAKMGDGWMPNTMPFDTARTMIDTLNGYLRDEGRDPADFGIDARLNVARVPESDWASYVQEWGSLGATHMAINTMGAGYTKLDDHLNTIRAFKESMDG